MSSIRTQITAQLQVLLGQITRDNSYRTNIGANVKLALTRGNQHEVPCVYLVPGSERGEIFAHGVKLAESDYVITAIVNRKEAWIADYPADPYAEWVIVDALIADVRGCVEGRDPVFYGSDTLTNLIERVVYRESRILYPEEGGELIGVEVGYSIQYQHDIGDPNSQANL